LLENAKKVVPSERLFWSCVHDSAATARCSYGPGAGKDQASDDIEDFSNQTPLIASIYLAWIRSHRT